MTRGEPWWVRDLLFAALVGAIVLALLQHDTTSVVALCALAAAVRGVNVRFPSHISIKPGTADDERATP